MVQRSTNQVIETKSNHQGYYTLTYLQPSTFTGCRMKDIVDYLGLTGGTIKALALNDYAVEIPVSDAVSDGPILAYAMDGATMSVRDKGPLWIVYPFDDKPEYRSEVIYTRAIWQLERFEVIR